MIECWWWLFVLGVVFLVFFWGMVIWLFFEMD